MTPPNGEVIDIFTRKHITEIPSHGFEDADHYLEWARYEAASDVIVLAETLRDHAETVEQVKAGLAAIRRQVNSMKPPKELDEEE